MRLTGRDVMQAVTETVIEQAAGEELDWGRVADRLNLRLAANLVGRPADPGGKHRRELAPDARN